MKYVLNKDTCIKSKCNLILFAPMKYLSVRCDQEHQRSLNYTQHGKNIVFYIHDDVFTQISKTHQKLFSHMRNISKVVFISKIEDFVLSDNIHLYQNKISLELCIKMDEHGRQEYKMTNYEMMKIISATLYGTKLYSDSIVNNLRSLNSLNIKKVIGQKSVDIKTILSCYYINYIIDEIENNSLLNKLNMEKLLYIDLVNNKKMYFCDDTMIV